jgi:hypothetical protein
MCRIFSFSSHAAAAEAHCVWYASVMFSRVSRNEYVFAESCKCLGLSISCMNTLNFLFVLFSRDYANNVSILFNFDVDFYLFAIHVYDNHNEWSGNKKYQILNILR